ncbi:mammalian ependymin-related protein 1-like [Ruditapes philippinarum]|uniref:mammalian ependymin-related protein 1-like n=1 Tax=Ruditapes philippinarum TaxID=129788 RepID=UPI00295BEA5E|nr:mammalian ependymin-related protein 1-like [Ruditapes philippinarum]
MKIVVGLALIIVCSAQVPTPCQSPKQWVARRIKMDRYKQYFEIAEHSYDELNRRAASREERDVGKERDYYLRIHLYNEGLDYMFNLRTMSCNVTRLTRPFRVVGVPLDSKFLFEGEYGAAGIPAEHFDAATFGGKFEDGAEYLVTVAEPDCIPIQFDVRSNTTTEHFHEAYYDLKLGIPDPTVFIPPKECMMVPIPPK